MSALLTKSTINLRSAVLRPLGCIAITPHRNASNKHHLSLVPKGRGGRSSFSGIVAAVFGGTGFVGRYLITRLGREGSQIVVPHRCDEYNLNHLKVMGDLGQLLFRDYTLHNEDLIRDIIGHCNVVINLIGSNNETRNFPYEAVHIDAARSLARYTKEAGVPRFIHMSALNADIKSDVKYLSTKAVGETVVKDEFPDATIIRPSLIFGPEDRYFNHFANQRFFGNVPLYPSASTTVKRPVYVSDVAEAIISCIKDKDTAGRTYELMGPRGYHLDDLVSFIYRVSRRPYVKTMIPRFALRAVARGFELTKRTPYLSREMLELQHLDEHVTAGIPGLEDLGVKATTVEDGAIRVLRRHRADRYFDLGIDDIEPAPAV
ncbi:NADH dehydrogenase [ubiquinone] 1 alpha subcomplex subunit 9, mitochondrial-like [Amphiura filiformis]|uniref:NADH dehydrogenase [ubiquinone] 1 alpha subcomplex subunit 9, mitochondrial-like n=1 Tax=Amphiura filiformis TaxID=82378 RepID=UPI003B21B9DA